jgi:hypothetical protein
MGRSGVRQWGFSTVRARSARPPSWTSSAWPCRYQVGSSCTPPAGPRTRSFDHRHSADETVFRPETTLPALRPDRVPHVALGRRDHLNLCCPPVPCEGHASTTLHPRDRHLSEWPQQTVACTHATSPLATLAGDPLRAPRDRGATRLARLPRPLIAPLSDSRRSLPRPPGGRPTPSAVIPKEATWTLRARGAPDWGLLHLSWQVRTGLI